jgi:topoisomerase-4 subunit B
VRSPHHGIHLHRSQHQNLSAPWSTFACAQACISAASAAGAHAEDGIYVLLKETIDNSIDEFMMGAGRKIEVELSERSAKVRDYGRGIPLGKLVDCVSIINTGAKYDSETFQKAVGLNGVGQKAVNALSFNYRAQAIREGETKIVEFLRGKLKSQSRVLKTGERNGTRVEFTPDEALFGTNFKFRAEFVEDMLWKYAFLNRGLTLTLNGKPFRSEHGLKDLLAKELSGEPLYPIIHLEGDDIEIAVTHGNHYGEEYWSFVNGQHTTMGGTHLAAFREAFVETIRNHFKKDFDAADVRQSIDAAIVVRVQEPVFESQTKTKLGSTSVGPKGPTIKGIRRQVRPAGARHLPAQASRDRRDHPQQDRGKRARAKGARRHPQHRQRAREESLASQSQAARLPPAPRRQGPAREESTLFIVEGDSAAGSLTSTRDVQTQAVFALKGKPLNTYGLTKKVIYENEEFHLLQAALNIEEGLDGPALQQDRHRHRRRRGRHAHPPAAALVLPAVLPRHYPQQPSLHPADAALPRPQQEGHEVLLHRAGKAGGHRRARRRPRDHALQGTRRDFGR